MDIKHYTEQLGATLLGFRKRAGLTQRKLEDEISVLGGNVRYSQISNYETGRERPSWENLLWFLAGCRATLGDLESALEDGEPELRANTIAELRRRLGQMAKRQKDDAREMARILEILEMARGK